MLRNERGGVGSLAVDAIPVLISGGSALARVAGRAGARVMGRVGGRAFISASRAVGNPRAIVRGLGSLSKQQQRVLSQLPNYGSRTIVPKRAFGSRDLSALTAQTGDEFAMFTTGGRRMVIRGDFRSVPIGEVDATQLAGMGWRWSAHTHPGTSIQVLRSSGGDRAILNYFSNSRSAIFNSLGDRILFTPAGDILTNFLPF
jgi:hypothetical protein